MPAAHVEAGQRDAPGTHQDGKANRLETGISPVVEQLGILGEAVTIGAGNEAQGVLLRLGQFAVSPRPAVGAPPLAAIAAAAFVKTPPRRIAGVKDLGMRHQAPGVIYR